MTRSLLYFHMQSLQAHWLAAIVIHILLFLPCKSVLIVTIDYARPLLRHQLHTLVALLQAVAYGIFAEYCACPADPFLWLPLR